MTALWPIFVWAWPVIGGVSAWLILELAAKPYLRFRTLRATVQAQLLALNTNIFVPLSLHNPSRAAMIEKHRSEIDRASRALRETGILLVTMADTEWLLNKILTALGYDLRTAGASLLTVPLLMSKGEGLSPPLDEKGDEFITIMRETLRLPNLHLFEGP